MTDPATAQATDVATDATLDSAAAVWNALLWRKIDFYPRVTRGRYHFDLGHSANGLSLHSPDGAII
jgi:hypothetical protein